LSARSKPALLLEFDDGDALLRAVRSMPDASRRGLSAYTPMPVEGLVEALGTPPSRRIPFLFLLGGLVGGLGTYLIEYYAAVIDYPINVGGRPLHSWPAFLPPSIEMVLMGAALFGVIGMLVMDGLPRFHHPLFDVPRFTRVTVDGFFLCVPCGGDASERVAVERFASEHGACGIYPVQPAP